jgi:acid phosphatase type 7
VQAQYLTNDPGYLGCKNAACQKRDASGACKVRTCAATITFHVVNFRTDVEFVLFSGGFGTPCVLKRSGALRFANPAKPLYGHLSSTDSKATSVSNRLFVNAAFCKCGSTALIPERLAHGCCR